MGKELSNAGKRKARRCGRDQSLRMRNLRWLAILRRFDFEKRLLALQAPPISAEVAV